MFLLCTTFQFCNTPPANAQKEKWPSVALWPVSQQLSQSTILGVVNGKDGLLWIAALDGISRFDGHELFEFRPHNLKQGYIASSNIVTIFEDEYGDLFAASRDAGLLRYSEETNSFISIKNSKINSINKQSISAAFYDGKGGIWIGCSGTIRMAG
jgi:ligand-binding sensor domain-containing protein